MSIKVPALGKLNFEQEHPPAPFVYENEDGSIVNGLIQSIGASGGPPTEDASSKLGYPKLLGQGFPPVSWAPAVIMTSNADWLKFGFPEETVIQIVYPWSIVMDQVQAFRLGK
jgi:hypothetical protein